jgi:hypothetical protein
MSDVKWLLEPEVFDGEEAPIVEALRNLGHDFETIKFGKGYDEYLTAFTPHDCVVFHGSIQGVNFYQVESDWEVGPYWDKFECAYYYHLLGPYLLNSQYVMIPFGDLGRLREWLFWSVFPTAGGCLFIRPSSGRKAFTGKIFTEETWDEDLKLAAFYKSNPDDMVVIAPEIDIDKEWRLLVVDGKVVTASQYKSLERPEPPAEVLAFGQKVIDESGYNPGFAWVLDICLAEEEFHVVEAGPFSCCALYNCDPAVVVQTVSEAAWRDHAKVRSQNRWNAWWP